MFERSPVENAILVGCLVAGALLIWQLALLAIGTTEQVLGFKIGPRL